MVKKNNRPKSRETEYVTEFKYRDGGEHIGDKHIVTKIKGN